MLSSRAPSKPVVDRETSADETAQALVGDSLLYASALVPAGERGGTAANGKPSLTITQAGFHLIGGEPGWSGALGVGYTVTYAFRASEPATMPDGVTGFSQFTEAQIIQTERALQSWADVANIRFVRVGAGVSGEGAYSNSASILFGNYSDGEAGAAAFAYYPGNPSFASASGDVWVNSTSRSNQNPTMTYYGAMTLVHEIGHAIGLSHPGKYDATDKVTFTYAADAGYFEDSTQYTVMSYFSETNTGAKYSGFHPSVPMLDDISAAQQEYGANLTTRTGDTTYGFNSNADRAWFTTAGGFNLIFAVWDAGGVDTFDFSGYSVVQRIDLGEGNFSNVGGLTGNVSIALGAQIENAIGGSAADVILGNGLDNDLRGNAGADRIEGGAGDDLLLGGAGADILVGGSGSDRFYGALTDLAGDTILDFARGDVLQIADASFASFVFSRNGAALTLGGDATLTLAGDPFGLMIAVAAAGGGVSLSIAEALNARNAFVADFNGDGRDDLAWRASDGAFSTWTIDLGGPAPAVDRDVFVESGVDLSWAIGAIADFNGDGKSDLLWRHDGGLFSLWRSTGEGFAANTYVNGSVGADWSLAATGDFNADGRADLIWRHEGGLFTVWRSNGESFEQNVYVDGGVDPSWQLIATGDYDGDGADDLLWRSASGGFTEWRSSGAGFTTNVYVDFTLDATWHLDGGGDFNGDGRDDLIWRRDDGLFSQWLSTGDGFEKNVYVSGAVGTDWSLDSTGDFNGDGKADLLWRHDQGTFTIWESTGTGFEMNVLVDGSRDAHWALAAKDYAFL